MKVNELKPGDEVTLPALGSVTFITAAPHPWYHGMALVIWTGIPPDGGLSLDALSWEQEVGEVTPGEPEFRGSRLWEVFTQMRERGES